MPDVFVTHTIFDILQLQQIIAPINETKVRHRHRYQKSEHVATLHFSSCLKVGYFEHSKENSIPFKKQNRAPHS